jgi:twitching motility protein PilT
MDIRKRFEDLLKVCVELGASDMHLTSEKPVSFRVDGRLRSHGEEVFSTETVAAMAAGIMTEQQQKEFGSRMTADLGYSSADGERYRVNCYREMGKPAMAVRHLDQSLLSPEELGLPARLKDLAYLKSGLVLVTGATGSGKSKTLAVLLDEINRNRECHVLTVEDPVEFVHVSRKSLIHHREVHTDVLSFADAVRAALREDPDVIMVGEMRDLETMQASITAAETGHLVFSTLHTGEAVGAIERFIGYFSGEEQAVARHRISMVLRAVIAQRLVVGANGKGRLPAVEMLMVTTAAANLIRTSKTRQLYSMMETGAKDGMWTLDQDLARLVKSNKIGRDVAMDLCNDKAGFDRLVSVAGSEGR